MFDAFNHVCDFLCIYITEAHAADEWPIRTKPKLCIKQQQTSDDRCFTANSLINDYQFSMPVYVDTIDNCFEHTYASWPVRAFIIENGKIQFILEPKLPGYYDFSDLNSELTRRFA